MDGSTCIVTGANSGIGRSICIALARMGARVVMVCRSAERARPVLVEVAKASPESRVDLLLADLSSQAEVRRLAGEIRERYPQIDVLIHNAGLYSPKRQTTVDGLEWTFAVNHLAPFLLTHLLRDALVDSAPARVITLASAAHKQGRMRFDDLMGDKKYRGWGAYAQSKLANILFTTELARRLQGTSVTANCVHPGVVATRFAQGGPSLMRWFFTLGRPFLRSPDQGAAGAIYLASDPDMAEVSGQYYIDDRAVNPSSAARDAAAARQLWEVSAQLTGIDG